MGDKISATGSCLCGKVKIKVNEMTTGVGACHCGMCRKWGGGPLLAVDCGLGVTFENEEVVSVYDSSDWAERGFCSECGSHLFYRLKESGQYIMSVGLFDNQQSLILQDQIFIDKKPEYYSFAQDTHEMTEAEVFAQYGGDTGN